MNKTTLGITVGMTKKILTIALLAILVTSALPINQALASPATQNPPPPNHKIIPPGQSVAPDKQKQEYILKAPEDGNVPTLSARTKGPQGEPSLFTIPQENNQSLHPNNSLNNWQSSLYENFENGPISTTWTLYDLSDDGYNRTWGLDTSTYNSATHSAWPAAGGTNSLDPSIYFYPDNLDTWMVAGPFNLSDGTSTDLSFSMRYDLEPDFDYIFAGASIDGSSFSGLTWTGSYNNWSYFDLDLSQYIGQHQVWVGFYFHSDATNPQNYEGAWIDDITLWKWVPPASSDRISNGGFEADAISPWDAGGSTTYAATTDLTHGGTKAAWLGGIDNAQDKLYQYFHIPSTTQAADITYWVKTESSEIGPGYDTFCARVYKTLPTANPLLDDGAINLGCMDGTSLTDGWKFVRYSIYGKELDDIRNQDLYLYFYVETDSSYPSSVWIDDVDFIVTEQAGDANEPNNTPDTATSTALGSVFNDLTIEPNGDQDWFAFNGLAGQTIGVNIDSEINGFALDSYVILYDANLQELTFNDDDGVTRDSYLTYTLPADGQYTIMVRSYGGEGDHLYQYKLKIWDTSVAEPAGLEPAFGISTAVSQNEMPNLNAAQKEWTFILYLNAAKSSEEFKIYDNDRKHLEQLIGSKSGLANIVVQVDGPGSNDTVRYFIQPNGNYRTNVNRWNMPEQDMGNPNTLSEFGKWAIQNYPAQHYLLILSDHGDGMRTSADNYSGSTPTSVMNPSQLSSALKLIKDKTGRKIDVFFNTSCLMGDFENAYTYKDAVDYYVTFETNGISRPSSSNTRPAVAGLLSGLTAGKSSVNLAKQLVDEYVSYMGINGVGNNGFVVSVFDLAKVENLKQKLDLLAYSLRNKASNTSNLYVSVIKLSRNLTQKMNTDDSGKVQTNSEYIDLWDFSAKIGSYFSDLSTPAANVRSAVDQVVIYKRTNVWCILACQQYNNAHGMSIYYPAQPNDIRSANYMNWYQVSRSGFWYPFISAYYSKLASSRISPTSSATKATLFTVKPLLDGMTAPVQRNDNEEPWWVNSPAMPVDMGLTETIVTDSLPNMIYLPSVLK